MKTTNGQKKESKDGDMPQSGTGFTGWLPFLLVAALIVALVIQQMNVASRSDSDKVKKVQETQLAKQSLRDLHAAMVIDEAGLRAEVLESNTQLGIDPEFPSFKFPIYPGLEIIESRREEAQSTLGEAMDMWFIHGQVDAELKDIETYYREAMMKADLRQTQYISIPGGYAFNYANEWYDSRFSIEKKNTDLMPQVEITVYRVRDDSVKFSD